MVTLKWIALLITLYSLGTKVFSISDVPVKSVAAVVCVLRLLFWCLYCICVYVFVFVYVCMCLYMCVRLYFMDVKRDL